MEIIGGGTPDTNNTAYWNGNIDWYSPTEIGNKPYVSGSLKKISVLGLQKSSAKILPANKTILFTSRAGIGDMAILTKQGTTNQGFQSFILKNDVDIYFLYSMGFKIKDFALKNASGSTFLEISKSQLSQMKLYLPSLKEQTQIGNFFKQLDDTIALHQRELEKFKILKTSYLENIFLGKVLLFTAKNTITWEQRKFLDNIESIIDFRGRTPRKLGMEWGESGYLALSALNVKNGCIDPSVDAHFGDEALYQKWMTGNELKQGQVLFTTEAPMGNVAQIPDDKKYILSQRTIAFNIKEKYITDDFLAVLLRSPNVFNDLDSLSSGGTAKGISQKSLSNLYVKVPNSLEEQTQIGNFFKQLDDTIALHQKELAKYQQIKAACLEKMFVE